jgi:hypothetical protein
MNNSLPRIIDGMIATLRAEIIPRLDDEFARGQAYGAVDLLNNLKPRIDWLVTPLYAEVQAQRALLEQWADIFRGATPQPPVAAAAAQVAPGATAGEIEQLRNRLDEHICGLIDWLARHRAVLPAAAVAAAESACKQHMQVQMKREMSLTPKPLFAEIARS